MRPSVRRLLYITFALGLLVTVRAPRGPAVSTAASTWTKISADTGLGIASAGLFRTADGNLHVVWPQHDVGDKYSLHWSTLGDGAKLLGTGAVVDKWRGVSTYPRLIAANAGMRLIFDGGDGKAGSPYDLGAVYSATSTAAGTKWTLTKGSLSQSKTVPATDLAAVAEKSGKPVAAWGGVGSLGFHEGIDPKVPAATPDGKVLLNKETVAVGPTLARDKDGSVWAAWFGASGNPDQGYWVDQILPTKGTKMKAPGSGGKEPLQNNQPLQSVAFAARTGGGLYLAYCVPNTTRACAHIALWKVGTAKAMVVPGSGTGNARHVALAAGPGGHLYVAWVDTAANKIRLVKTNAAATSFGPVQSVPTPPKTDGSLVYGVQADATHNRLDVVVLALQTIPGAKPAYWDVQP